MASAAISRARRCRTVSSRSTISVSNSSSTCTATSCSTTGVLESWLVRLVAMRRTRSWEARIQPTRRPAQTLLLNEPTVITRSELPWQPSGLACRADGSRVKSRNVSSATTKVRRRERVEQLATLSGGGVVAGRVLMVGGDVREHRGRGAARRSYGREVPAVDRDADRGHPQPVCGRGVGDRRVAGGLEQHPVTGPGQRAQQQVPGVQGALGDQDLVG